MMFDRALKTTVSHFWLTTGVDKFCAAQRVEVHSEPSQTSKMFDRALNTTPSHFWLSTGVEKFCAAQRIEVHSEPNQTSKMKLY